MAILNFAIDQIGQAGQKPNIVYFRTNNTIDDLVTTGFLNDFVSQNNGISEYSMALVVTKATPASPPQLYFYNIVFSEGNWSFVAY
jgi:chromosome condensin MukBEF complex kleisin-like MukF subunit